MAYTYNTIGTFTAGDVLTAAEMNEIGENSNNYRKPPMCSLYITSDKTSYANNTALSWDAEYYDTDGMWGSGSTITINTAGVYVVQMQGYLQAATSLTAAYLFTSTHQVIQRGENNAAQPNLSFVREYSAGNTLSFTIGFNASGAVTVKGTTDDRTRAKCSVTWVGQAS